MIVSEQSINYLLTALSAININRYYKHLILLENIIYISNLIPTFKRLDYKDI